jgi:hypothetical protein
MDWTSNDFNNLDDININIDNIINLNNFTNYKKLFREVKDNNICPSNQYNINFIAEEIIGYNR